MSDLSRRAVACPRWRWMRGSTALILYREHPCADVEPERMRHMVTCDGALGLSAYAWMGIANHDPLPDLTDPATIGCLLFLVREAHAWLQSTEYVGDGDPVNPWRWGSFRGASEAEALVNALEGAP